MNFLSKLILVVSIFCIITNTTQAMSSYFLMTPEDDKIPLFTSKDEHQKILDTHLATTINPEITISQHCLEIDKDVSVNFSWYQSGKAELIVLAVGKGGTPKDKLPFIKEFTQNYDVITFDYEWQNPAPLYKRLARIASPLKRYFEHNYREIHAIVNYVRQQKKYDCIIGHAECYSAFMFVKAQALNGDIQLFDKLVLDSPILSVKNVIKSLFKNPALCANPLDGESSVLVKTLVGNKLFLKLIDICSKDYSIQEYLAKINIPVLFIRGMNDAMVNEGDFLTLWKTANDLKVAFMTPYHHADSFKQKNGRREYLYIENLFIQNAFAVLLSQNLFLGE